MRTPPASGSVTASEAAAYIKEKTVRFTRLDALYRWKRHKCH